MKYQNDRFRIPCGKFADSFLRTIEYLRNWHRFFFFHFDFLFSSTTRLWIILTFQFFLLLLILTVLNYRQLFTRELNLRKKIDMIIFCWINHYFWHRDIKWRAVYLLCQKYNERKRMKYGLREERFMKRVNSTNSQQSGTSLWKDLYPVCHNFQLFRSNSAYWQINIFKNEQEMLSNQKLRNQYALIQWMQWTN